MCKDMRIDMCTDKSVVHDSRPVAHLLLRAETLFLLEPLSLFLPQPTKCEDALSTSVILYEYSTDYFALVVREVQRYVYSSPPYQGRERG